jgi:transposase
MLLSEGQMSDYKGAALMIDALPKAKALLGDRGYDADWFRSALAERKINACIPSKTNRKVPIPHGRALPPTPQDRDHVRQAQGLAAYPHPLRSLRAHLHVRHLHRRNRHLLDQ